MNNRQRKKRIKKDTKEILQALKKFGIDPEILVNKFLRKALDELKEEKKK